MPKTAFWTTHTLDPRPSGPLLLESGQLHYCIDAESRIAGTVVAEAHNTLWGEQRMPVRVCPNSGHGTSRRRVTTGPDPCPPLAMSNPLTCPATPP